MNNFSLNKKQIEEYQKNRDPYLFIDFVDNVVPGESIEGYKDLRVKEWFFDVHWPGDPNMPGMLQIEALTQMSALSILTLPGNKGKIMYLISAEKLVFKRASVPMNNSSPMLVPSSCCPDSIPFAISSKPSM